MLRQCLAFVLAASVLISVVDAKPPTRPGAMQQSLSSVEFASVPFRDVVDYIRDTTQLNIHVDWPALELAGVDPNQAVSLRLRNVQAGKVLDLALRQVGGGQLTWVFDENILYITTREQADRKLVTRVYPVQDLLVEVPDFKGPSLSLNNTTRSGEGGGGASMIASGSSSSRDDSTMQERGEELVEVIIALVRPEIWQQNGGSASIRYFNGNLVITAPLSVHRQI
jgi:type II secretory pathway component GspD/PulD (secretin)